MRSNQDPEEVVFFSWGQVQVFQISALCGNHGFLLHTGGGGGCHIMKKGYRNCRGKM